MRIHRPCENTSRSQGLQAKVKSILLTPHFGCPASRTVRKVLSLVEGNWSVVFYYGILSRLIPPYRPYEGTRCYSKGQSKAVEGF